MITRHAIALQFKRGATVRELAFRYRMTDLKIEGIIRMAFWRADYIARRKKRP